MVLRYLPRFIARPSTESMSYLFAGISTYVKGKYFCPEWVCVFLEFQSVVEAQFIEFFVCWVKREYSVLFQEA